jgi:DNA-binding transcriptional LysR family regulator
MLVYNLAHDPYSLRLKRSNTVKTVRIRAALDSNDGQILLQAALAGLGILIQPLYIIQQDIAAGRLVPVMREWTLPVLTMNVAYQNRERVPMKIRVFTDFLIRQVRARSPKGMWVD